MRGETQCWKDAKMPDDRAASKEITTCPYCGSECFDHRINLTLRRSAEEFVVIRDVDAEVCECCGESQFTLETTGKIMSLLHGDGDPDSYTLIPVYKMSAA